jgi:hypothetical protein
MAGTLTQERARELVAYDPETGLFRWTVGRVGCSAGAVAGSACTNGYRRIKLDRREYLAHRLAWFWMTGAWPSREIDHANGDKSDNSWRNLREATRSQNKANTRARSDSASGVKGVRWHRGKWRASIEVDGRAINLGRFDDMADAAAAYDTAELQRFGQFARAAGGAS